MGLALPLVSVELNFKTFKSAPGPNKEIENKLFDYNLMSSLDLPPTAMWE